MERSKTNPSSLHLSPTLDKFAEELLGETEIVRQEAIELLRQQILSLPKEEDRLQDISEKNLIRFLRSRKFRQDRALDCTIQYQHFMNKHGKYLKDFTPDEILFYKEIITFIYEPISIVTSEQDDQQQQDNGRMIVILQMKKLLQKITPDFQKTNPKFMIRFRYFLFELISHDPYAQIHGIILIFSCHGFTFWDQMAVSRLASVQDHLACFQHFSILGTRFKGAFLLEEPPFISWLWYFLTPILSEKMKSRFRFCGKDFTHVQQEIRPIKILPKFLGGEREDDDVGNWLEERLLEFFASSN